MVLSPNSSVALFITFNNRTSSMILMIFYENIENDNLAYCKQLDPVFIALIYQSN